MFKPLLFISHSIKKFYKKRVATSESAVQMVFPTADGELAVIGFTGWSIQLRDTNVFRKNSESSYNRHIFSIAAN